MKKIWFFLTISFVCHSADYLLNYPVINKEKIVIKTLRYPDLLDEIEYLIDGYIKKFDRELSYLEYCNKQKNSDTFLKDYTNIFRIYLENLDNKNSISKKYQNDVQIYSDFSKYEIERFCQSEFFDVAVIWDVISLIENDFSILHDILESAFLVFVHIPPKIKFLDFETLSNLQNIEKEILKRKSSKLQTEIMKAYGSTLYLISNSKKKTEKG